jgi:hypothetical protein
MAKKKKSKETNGGDPEGSVSTSGGDNNSTQLTAAGKRKKNKDGDTADSGNGGTGKGKEKNSKDKGNKKGNSGSEEEKKEDKKDGEENNEELEEEYYEDGLINPRFYYLEVQDEKARQLCMQFETSRYLFMRGTATAFFFAFISFLISFDFWFSCERVVFDFPTWAFDSPTWEKIVVGIPRRILLIWSWI